MVGNYDSSRHQFYLPKKWIETNLKSTKLKMYSHSDLGIK